MVSLPVRHDCWPYFLWICLIGLEKGKGSAETDRLHLNTEGFSQEVGWAWEGELGNLNVE